MTVQPGSLRDTFGSSLTLENDDDKDEVLNRVYAIFDTAPARNILLK
ncbi:MAG: hypothetical protein VX709_01190 [Pseudomonadota bacterium]|nr:hypothetical protein [Pseudomonadota bacterium]